MLQTYDMNVLALEHIFTSHYIFFMFIGKEINGRKKRERKEHNTRKLII